MANALQYVIEKFIADGKDIQVKLRGDANPGPLGPGKIVRLQFPTSPPVFIVRGIRDRYIAASSRDRAEMQVVCDKRNAEIVTFSDGSPDRFEVVEEAGPMVVAYELSSPAMLGTHGQQPRMVMLPIIFSIDDVLWLSLGPTNADGEDVVQAPPRGRTSGGLHIPGS